MPPLNGSGTYAAPASTWNPAQTGTTINSSDFIALLADITTALSTAVYKDGQSTPTNNLPMGGFKFTGLAAGATAGNSLRYEQLFSTSAVALLGAMDWVKGADIASATTTNLTTATGNAVHVTGTTTITAITLGSGMWRLVIFDGALTLTHHATNNNLPGASNITTAAGDRALYWSDGTTVYCASYVRASGTAVIDQAPIAAGRNIAARTNSGTPNTKLDITADELILRDASGNAFRAASVSVTTDFGTVGANGIDAGTLASSTWYYNWAIAKPDGTVAGLGSTSSTAPTMPSGYTFKALVSAARSDGSTHFIPYRQRGNKVFYEILQAALAAGTAAVETAVSLTALIPPIALRVQAQCQTSLAAGANAALWSTRIYPVTGANFFDLRVEAAAAASPVHYNTAVVEFPNVSQNLFYITDIVAGTTGTSTVKIDVQGFALPGAGE